MGEALRLYEQLNTFPDLTHLVSRIAQTQQNSCRQPVVLDGTFGKREVRVLVRDGRMQGSHGLTEQ